MHRRTESLVSFLPLSLIFACAASQGAPKETSQAKAGATAAIQTSPTPAATHREEPKPPEKPSLEALPAFDPACGMPEKLHEDSWPRVLEPTTAKEPAAFTPGAFTIAVLPDTQYYAACNSPHFKRQSQWLKEQVASRAISGVIHLGDITENNTEAEWQYAVDSLSPLSEVAPVLLATGNHDYGAQGSADIRQTLFHKYFSAPSKLTQSATVETMKPADLENAYYRLKLGKRALGVLILEWSPRTATVAWANEVLGRFATDRVIFVTHAYLFNDNTRYDFQRIGPTRQPWNPLAYGTAREPDGSGKPNAEGAYDGEMLWRDLVKRHRGVFLTLNGHVLGDGTGLLSSQGNAGNTVHQILSNYQMLDQGGLGYLRLLEFQADGRTLRVKTYSPSLERFATAPDQNFELKISPPLW